VTPPSSGRATAPAAARPSADPESRAVTDDATLAARHARSQRAAYRVIVDGSPGARLAELAGGVQAAVVPARPDRSLFNAVLFREPAALLSAHDELAALYAAAGVRAWTVWTRPGDDATPVALAAAGHVHDGEPMLMAAALEQLDLEATDEFELAPTDAWDALARCNDAAYRVAPEQGFTAALGAVRDPAARAWVALEDGEPAAAVGTLVHEGDCYVLFVATVPAAQGHGLASALMHRALRDGRKRGCTTTTLEATARGEPVYARLGYRPLGRMGMWERRDS
jgi:ribosomal protein S18 acetylase RimI-like enzyme